MGFKELRRLCIAPLKLGWVDLMTGSTIESVVLQKFYLHKVIEMHYMRLMLSLMSREYSEG